MQCRRSTSTVGAVDAAAGEEAAARGVAAGVGAEAVAGAVPPPPQAAMITEARIVSKNLCMILFQVMRQPDD